MKKLLFAGAALSAIVAFAGAASADITIATAGPMTGQYAAFGAQMKAGAEQAVADINAAGGVLGQQLVLEVGDDACDPKQAVAVANQLAGKGVSLVAGHFCSGSSIPASAVYDELEASSRSRRLRPTRSSPTSAPVRASMRVCGRDDQQGMVAGAFLAKTLQGQEHRHHRRQERLRQRPRRRDPQVHERGGQDRGPQRVLQRRREGLLGAGLQAEGGQHRRALCRRLPHRGRPDQTPDGRPGHEHASSSPATRWSPTSTGRSPATPAPAR